MGALEKLRALGKELSEKYLSIDAFPTKVYSGSIGDPYGHVRSNSDVDMEVWTTEFGYKEKTEKESLVDWSPHKWKFKTKRRPDFLVTKNGEITVTSDIDILKLQDGTDASICFLHIDKEKFLQMPKILESNIKESDINVHYSPINFGLRYFCETTLVEDSTDVFKSCEKITRENFEENRNVYAKDFLSRRGEGGRVLRLFSHKIKEDVEGVENGEELDPTRYNQVSSGIVNALTYLSCLVENVPRTYDSLFGKRKNILWESLGLDKSKIYETQISANNGVIDIDEVRNSSESLKILTQEIYRKAKKEFPEIELSGVTFLRK